MNLMNCTFLRDHHRGNLYSYIQFVDCYNIIKAFLCSQLASNGLTGQIPDSLFHVSKYKYGQHSSFNLNNNTPNLD